MTRYLTKTATVFAALALIATAATAQGWGRGGGRGGRGARWANVSQEDGQKVADLHQKIRQAQWELWTLRDQEADAKAIEQKRKEVLRLRGDLAKVMTDLPAGPCYQASPSQRNIQLGC